MRKAIAAVIICALILVPGVASAHPGHPEHDKQANGVVRIERTETAKQKSGAALAIIVVISAVVLATAAWAVLNPKRSKK